MTYERPEAIVYDVDGTLIDSEPLHVAAWKQTLQSHGHDMSDLSAQFLQTMAGKKPIVIAEGMVKELGIDVPAEQFLQEKTNLFLALSETSLQPMPGAVESVRRFSDAGLRLAIGTSLNQTYLESVLQKLNIAEAFDVIVTGDEITKGKPNPETYLLVASKLGVKPSDMLVLEDARSGVEAAKASGAFCIGVENIEAEPQDLSFADKVVQSLNDVTLELVESFCSGN